jgi:hypothetical protein
MSASAPAAGHRRAPEGARGSGLVVGCSGTPARTDAVSRCGRRPLGSAFCRGAGRRGVRNSLATRFEAMSLINGR